MIAPENQFMRDAQIKVLCWVVGGLGAVGGVLYLFSLLASK